MGNIEKNILVVDDDLISRKVLGHMLRTNGNNVIEVEGGDAAIEKVRQEVFDIIFMDIHMPGKNGSEATREIRKLIEETQGKMPKIIGISAGYHTSEFHNEFDELFIKPIKIQEIKTLLNK